MRFSALNTSFNKLTGLAAALMILPVAVSCGTDTATAPDADITSEVPADVPGAIEGEAGAIGVPGESESIVDVAEANGSFNTLVAAVQAVGLEETLEQPGPYTVFAPTDDAFASLPEGTVEKLAKPENQEALREILAYHVVAGAVTSDEIQPGAISTVEGEDIEVSVDPAGVMVNGTANVVQPDIAADNGVIHVVDTVLLPPTFDPATLL